MNNYEKIYWITRLDSINDHFSFVAVICSLVIVGIFIAILLMKDFDQYYSGDKLKERLAIRDKLKSQLKWLLLTLSISTIITTFVPTKNEAMIIIAGGKTMDFIQQDSSINKVPEQTTLLISKFLEQKINELDSNNVSSKK